MSTLAFVFAGLGGPDDGGRQEIPRDVRAARASAHAAHDTRLAEQIRDGDHAAFTTVFLAHYDGLRRFAEGYTRNATEAEEITEAVFARVWERRSEFTPTGSVAAYLYASVRNRALNAVRDAQFRDTWEAEHTLDMAMEGAVPGMSVSSTSLLADLEQEELGVVLRRVIDTLPEHRRAVVTMRWFGGLSHAEIAAALGTSANAVEIQLRRALKELAAGVPEHLRG